MYVNRESRFTIMSREDSQIDFAKENVILNVFLRQGRRNSRGHGRGTFWPISIFIYRKSIEVFYSLMSILI